MHKHKLRKLGKNSVLYGNHFHWKAVALIKTKLQHSCFNVTEAVARRCASKLRKIHSKKSVLENF